MKNEFPDITTKLGKPKWYDVKGYPRYCRFHPDKQSNIYASLVALIEVGCQNCERKWVVCVSVDRKDFKRHIEFPSRTSIGDFHYGDPPSHVKEDHAGSTMNSIPLRVIQFWSKNFYPVKKGKKFIRWVRIRRYEIKIKVDWMQIR
jgi:hypothetical protein